MNHSIIALEYLTSNCCNINAFNALLDTEPRLNTSLSLLLIVLQLVEKQMMLIVKDILEHERVRFLLLDRGPSVSVTYR